jgi:hypothetical protein
MNGRRPDRLWRSGIFGRMATLVIGAVFALVALGLARAFATGYAARAHPLPTSQP